MRIYFRSCLSFSNVFLQKFIVLVLFFHVAVWPVGVGDDHQLMPADISSAYVSVFPMFNFQKRVFLVLPFHVAVFHAGIFEVTVQLEMISCS